MTAPEREETLPLVRVIYRGGFIPDLGITSGGRFDGWLMMRHPDGHWVSCADLSPYLTHQSAPPSIGDTQECTLGSFCPYQRDTLRQSAPQQEPIGYQDLAATSQKGFLSVRDRKVETWDRPLYAAPSAQPDVRFVGGIAPSHWCKVCGALWRQWGDGSWNLRSRECGKCCDSISMGEQIDVMGAPTLASDYTASPQPDVVRDALLRALKDIENASIGKHGYSVIREMARKAIDAAPSAQPQQDLPPLPKPDYQVSDGVATTDYWRVESMASYARMAQRSAPQQERRLVAWQALIPPYADHKRTTALVYDKMELGHIQADIEWIELYQLLTPHPAQNAPQQSAQESK